MSDERRIYVVDWLEFAPGRRAEVLKHVPDYAAACRREKGCLFFEMHPSMTEPNLIVVSECFASREAHEAHKETPHFKVFRDLLGAHCHLGRFENVYPGEVEPDKVTF